MVLLHALAELPDTLKTAVLMRDIREMTYQEIADKLHLPEGTVQIAHHRGRTELARHVKRMTDSTSI